MEEKTSSFASAQPRLKLEFTNEEQEEICGLVYI